MKKLHYLLLLVFVLCSANSFARKKISFGTSEVLTYKHDLPNTEDYYLEEITGIIDGKPEKIKLYLDLGMKYKVFCVAGFPIWVTESPKVVGMNAWNRDKYYELTPEDLDGILKENNLTEEQFTQLSFFDKYSGWLVIIVLGVLYMLYTKFTSRKSKPDEIEE